MKMDSTILTQYRNNGMNPVNNSMFYGSQSEVISVPDRMVGLIIGKGGEQIANIQNESECRIQFAPDSHGLQERQCTLTGSLEAILKAKDLIAQIMSKGHDLPPDLQNGSQTIEVMIPGNKAGIIIGKGGETIKQLQEQAGVRMVIIQENNTPTNYDKPLRISGDRISCQKAKELVMGLLADKDVQLGANNSFGGSSCAGGGSVSGGTDYMNGSQRSSIDILVPRSMIGIVIGKGGEMIKKIQQESGARIQFRPDDESGGPNRLCSITGNHEQMSAATILMNDILDRQGAEMGWTRSKVERTRFNGSTDEITFSVPADKCGLVIGKGGETIREICRNSGAHVELNRDHSTNQQERVFRIQGNNEQTQNAIRLISEKAGIIPPVSIREVSNMLSNHTISGGNYDENSTINGNGQQQQQQIQSMSSLATSLAQQQNTQQQNNVQQNSLQQQNNLQQNNLQQNNLQQNNLQQMMTQPSMTQQALLQQQSLQHQILQQQTLQQLLQQQQQQQALAALQAWPSNALHYNAQPLQTLQQTTSIDSVKQMTDTAQWAAYLYQQQQQQQLTQLSQQPYATNITRANLSSPASINPQTGQPDYTLQWADYYRQQGFHQQAQAILQASNGQLNQ